MALIFVDCEAWGGCPATGQLTEFGAVRSEHSFYHGIIVPSIPNPENPAIPLKPRAKPDFIREVNVAQGFMEWLNKDKSRPVFVSDNPAFDWQWINDLFHRTMGMNPVGHSARRISDYYAGLTNNWSNTQKWKRLRRTKHTHHPVDDALGNLEAWQRIQQGER